MILTLLVWLLLSVIFIEAGRLILGTRADSIILTWLCGFASVAVLAQGLSIFMPLGDIFLPAIFLSIVVQYILKRKSKMPGAFEFYNIRLREIAGLKKMSLLLIIAGSLFIIYKSSVVPHNYDSGLYHAQSIKWMEEYPVIPGLANLDPRQGFNSIWFAASAFSAFSYSGMSFHALNGLLYLLAFLLGIRSLQRIAAADYSVHHWIGLIPAFTYFIFVKNLSSPSPDMPATMFCIFTVYYFLRTRADDDYTLVVSLLAAFAVVIKLSVLVILILPFVLVLRQLKTRQFRILGESVLIILLVLAPWLARNVIVSGYLIFPLKSSALFESDWKVPEDKAESLGRTISAWARIPAKPADEVLSMSFSEWIPVWFKTSAVVMPYDKLFLFLFIAALLYRVLRIAFRRRTLLQLETAFFICAAGVIIWFLMAPDFRFVYGFLLPAIVLGFYEPIKGLLDYSRRIINPQLLLGLALLLMMGASTYAYSRVFIKDSPVTEFIYKPQGYPEPASMQRVSLQNQNIHIIFDPDCQRWSAPIPAICDISILEQIQLRGKNLNNGFRTRSKQ